MGRSYFDTAFVIGYNRVPLPPAKIMPFINGYPPMKFLVFIVNQFSILLKHLTMDGQTLSKHAMIGGSMKRIRNRSIAAQTIKIATTLPIACTDSHGEEYISTLCRKSRHSHHLIVSPQVWMRNIPNVAPPEDIDNRNIPQPHFLEDDKRHYARQQWQKH